MRRQQSPPRWQRVSVPVGKCRPAVLGFSASIFRSASRLKAIAALRPVTMHKRMPTTSGQRTLRPFGKSCSMRLISKMLTCGARSGMAESASSQRNWKSAPLTRHAISAANSANGNANSVWLKRIISRIWRTRVNMDRCRRLAACRLSLGLRPAARGLLLRAPPFHQPMLDTKLIADASDDEIDQLVDRFCSVIKPWARGQHDCTSLGGPPHIVNLRQR